MTRCFLLLVLLRSSLLAKQLSLVHAFSPSSSSSAARPSLVGTAAARRHHRSLATVTMISVNNNNKNNNNNNNNAVEENGLSFTSSSTRRDILLAATATAAAITTTATTYPPLPAMAAAPASGSGVIVVAGATGQTGRRILERLSEAATGGVTTSLVIVGGVRDTTGAQKSLSESSTVIRGAMIQRVNSINTGTTNGGGGGRLELKHLDVVKDTVDELKATLTGASALVIATGFVPGNPLKMNAAAHEVDNVGTCKLIDAAKAAGITKVVMISSILANGRNWGQTNSPGFMITNAFGNVLDEKLVAENYLRNSGIPNWTIVRPGGLKSTPPSGALRISGEDTLNSGEVSRDLVADVVVAALTDGKATNKVLEIIENEEEGPKVFNGLIM